MAYEVGFLVFWLPNSSLHFSGLIGNSPRRPSVSSRTVGGLRARY